MAEVLFFFFLAPKKDRRLIFPTPLKMAAGSFFPESENSYTYKK